MKTKLSLVPFRLNFFTNPNPLNRMSNPNLQWRFLQHKHSNPSSLQSLLPSRTPNPSPHTSQNPNPNFKSLLSIRTRSRLYTSFSHSSDRQIVEIVELISRNEGNMESTLNQKHLNLSHSAIVKILRSLNDKNVSALRFFNWVLSNSSMFKPGSEIYNLIVDNLGQVDDFRTMFLMLSEFALKKHCLTEKAFTFLRFRSSSGLNDLVRGVVDTLNKVGGTSRGSGIYSLIKVLCGMNSFDHAVFVMEETGRRTSYYNVLIAAKCRSGDFEDARKVLGEMRRFGCNPNINSYNYLLGSLFKHKRVAEACDLMETMEGMGYFPDSVTFEVVTVHACKSKRMDFATEFLDRMLAEGIRPRLTTHAAFIKGYFWSGRVNDAYKYVIDMSMRDNSSANTNYSLFARFLWSSGRVLEAGGILHEMMEKGLKPNFPIYVKVMKDLHKMSRRDLSSELKSMFSKFIQSTEKAG